VADSYTTSRRDLFGGHGEVTVTDCLQGRARPPFTAALQCTLEAGGTVGPHQQAHCPELVYVIDGSGEATVDGVAHPLQPGSLVYLPLGSVLALASHGDAPLRYLIVKAALGA